MDPRFSIKGKTIAVTGGGGILAGAMAKELAQRGAHVAILDLLPEAAEKMAASIRDEGGQAIAVTCNVLKKESIQDAYECITSKFGNVDILINAAGGNKKEATTSDQLSFFDLPDDAMRFVIDLNLLGTVMPSQVFGKAMTEQGYGNIINISSMNSFRPLTKIIGYSAAKAAVNNFTQWLAVYICQNYSSEIRVNAIAPGFFETTQNKFLLRDEATGNLTPRGQQIVDHTPMGRFGEPDDLLGTLVWLCSPASKFITGIVVPVDGGFSAFSGV